MEAKFGSEVASVVEVAIQAAVSVFRDVWAAEGPNTEWSEEKLGEIQEIEKNLVVQIHKVFTEFSSELLEENEALKAKVEQLEDVLQRKAGQLQQELEARVGQLGRDMEQLEQELRSISDGGNKTEGALPGERVINQLIDHSDHMKTLRLKHQQSHEVHCKTTVCVQVGIFPVAHITIY